MFFIKNKITDSQQMNSENKEDSKVAEKRKRKRRKEERKGRRFEKRRRRKTKREEEKEKEGRKAGKKKMCMCLYKPLSKRNITGTMKTTKEALFQKLKLQTAQRGPFNSIKTSFLRKFI